MKKVVVIILCLVFTFSMVACAGNEVTPEPIQEATAEPAPEATPESASEEIAEPTYEKQTIMLSFFGAETSHSGMGVAKFKELVEERSGGAITVETYYNGTLYNQSNEYEALMKGDVDIIITALNYAMEYITELKSTFCPYMWVSIDHVRDFWLEHETGRALMARVEDELGVRQLSWYEGGYRNTYLNKDIKVSSRESLAGIKMRASTAENMIALTSALGGNPIPVPFSDTYLAIQTGVADGLEANLTGLISNGLDEVTKSVTLTQHYLALDGFAVSYNNFKTWAPEVQELITQCAQEAADYICELVIQADVEIVETLKDKGITVYELTEEEMTAYSEQVREAFLNSDFASDYDMDLLDSIVEMGKKY
jgi:TRAP-type C4-dicarboxylate transport system substrate-binding protein